ncbi:uncharacterized protein LOC115690200 isoform X2 [Syzygium oleosum]|uniref:uncharacterized protein LOC115690200 isoform X2 n=1 Tax=Syzygium oleosum TaxID=219896 RepID=UPI0024BB6828|nr:uncharacterized protein LOC115690200 isoform X2 [Syzygium oleosum]
MPENPSSASAVDPAAAAAAAAAVKRYAPPNQSDGEKNHTAASRNTINDQRDAGRSNLPKENPHLGSIALEGCSTSEASRLLNDRWEATIRNCNDLSIESSERPVMYSGSTAPAWGAVKLPHQLIAPSGVGSPNSQMDFLSELRRAMRNANAGS